MRKCPECGATYRGTPDVCPLDGTKLIDGDDLCSGREVGGWILRELIAEGPLATVYRAARGSVQGALKLYRPLDNLRRALREGEVQAQVTHRHVAAVLARGATAEGQAFVVTELIMGQSLRDLLTTSGKLPGDEAIRLTDQMAAGLEAIHEAGLVHRDIKPSNLMLAASHEAERSQVKILDLGHALALNLHRLTESGLVWGSAPYMSPEQAAGHRVDRRSDLYSLGVVLYEMLMGRRPFEAKAAVDVMAMHWNSVPVHPSEGSDIDSRLGDLCMWLLSKSPEGRPRSARIVHAILAGMRPARKIMGPTAWRSPGEAAEIH